MIFDNQFHSQNDTLILGPFWRRRAKQNGRQPLASAHPKVAHFRPFWARIQARPSSASGRFWAPKMRPGLQPQDRRVEFGGPNPAVLARPEMRGLKIGCAARIPRNRGPIWPPNVGSAPGPQSRPQVGPNSACNAGQFGPLQSRPMEV